MGKGRDARRGAGVRARVTATAVLAVGVVLVLAAFAMVAFVDRALAAQAGDAAALHAEQIADRGVVPGSTVVVADPEEEFVQVLDGSVDAMDVVASSANVAGLGPIATPAPEDPVRLTVPNLAGPFIAASAEGQGLTDRSSSSSA